MAYVSDFTSDNVGNPDRYTVVTSCRRITVQEKDRTAVTLAKFNVYPRIGDSGYKQFLGGETFTYDPGYVLQPKTQIFALETVGVASTVFSIVEE